MEVSFVPMTLIGTSYDGAHDQERRTWANVKQGFTHFAEGDTGVAKITPCFENGKACIFSDLTNGLGAGTTELHIVRPVGQTLSSHYVLAYLKSPQFLRVGETKMTGTAGQKRLPRAFVESNPFPFPPLSEQHRIVAKIAQLMARCDELETLRTKREQKRRSVHTAALKQLLDAQASDRFANAWQFITQNFCKLYAVKENVAELRKGILRLAVMGKLVPQNPNDPPTSQLIKEIETEKKRLVKEGKIKPPKPLPEIKPEEAPYPLPEGWEWVRIFELVDVGTGSTPATANRDYYNGNIPWYTSSATNNLFADTPETLITEKAIKETNCKIFPAGSLIIALYGQGKTRGQISEILTPGATNQAIAAMVFHTSSKGIKDYLKYFFIKIYEEIRALAEGAAQPNLNVGKIKETLVPLPPLAEQHRIVAKIDQLMALCDALEQQIDAATGKQTELLNSIMAQV